MGWRVVVGTYPHLTWEPVSGFEPLACRLQEVRPRTPSALAAPMTRIIALTALAALGLFNAPVHEPVHVRAGPSPMIVTQRSNLRTRACKLQDQLTEGAVSSACPVQ